MTRHPGTGAVVALHCCSTFNSGAATYTYDAIQGRVRKDGGGTWTEYVRFNGKRLVLAVVVSVTVL
jgi:hypothetical protein